MCKMRKLQSSNFNVSEYRSIGSWIQVEEVLVRERDVEVTGMIYGKGLRKTMKGEGGPDPGARTRGSGGMGGCSILACLRLGPGAPTMARGQGQGPLPGEGTSSSMLRCPGLWTRGPGHRARGPGPSPCLGPGSSSEFRVGG